MTTRPIVVGVDGSTGSQVALEWAIREAKVRGAPVEAVHVWQLPFVGDAAGMAAFTVDGEAVEQASRSLLDGVVDGVEHEGVEIGRHLERGDTAGALLRAAEALDADLLVVGSRGRGGFAGLLLGSVSQQIVHHSTRPVVVVPAPASGR